MRCLKRNKSRFYYALFDRKQDIVDEYGNVTGEYEIVMGNPVEYFANVSAAVGETQTRQFGDDVTYDKVIVMDMDAPNIDEQSVLWIDTMPEIDEIGSTETPHDYIVKRVARSLNPVSLAISKVTVRG